MKWTMKTISTELSLISPSRQTLRYTALRKVQRWENALNARFMTFRLVSRYHERARGIQRLRSGEHLGRHFVPRQRPRSTRGPFGYPRGSSRASATNPRHTSSSANTHDKAISRILLLPFL